VLCTVTLCVSDNIASTGPGNIVEQAKIAKGKLSKALTEFVAASGLRMWLCELMTSAHASNGAVMTKVDASLEHEKQMAVFVRETRQAQEHAGMELCECGVSRQLEVIDTTVPQLQQLLQNQLLQLKTAIEMSTTTVTDRVGALEDTFLEALGKSERENSGLHAKGHELLLALPAVLEQWARTVTAHRGSPDSVLFPHIIMIQLRKRIICLIVHDTPLVSHNTQTSSSPTPYEGPDPRFLHVFSTIRNDTTTTKNLTEMKRTRLRKYISQPTLVDASI